LGIIEQAARRLEELRRSGVEVPARGKAGDATAAVPQAASTEARRTQTAARLPSGLPTTAGVQALPGKRSKQIEIDLPRLEAMGYITPEAPRSQISSEFRVIKRPILNNVRGKSAAPVERANLVMVTSSLPGEGKTFVAINLAMTIAMELDTTVLLVDADVSRPSVLNRLGLPTSRGLLDVLIDPTLDPADVMLRTNVPNLSLLPAGAPQGRATEFLSSDNMVRLVDELASRYSDRLIIFDTPPILPSTESRVLASHMGQVVVVVAAERTLQSSVHQTLAALDTCPVLLPLLNKISRSEVGAHYGYYAAPAEGQPS
jgi:exopolysaccharide/PEP-CTERM locus tyrosine autokinase